MVAGDDETWNSNKTWNLIGKLIVRLGFDSDAFGWKKGSGTERWLRS